MSQVRPGKPRETPSPSKHPEWERTGETLRTLRERYGASQDELAREVGVSRSYIALIESGHKPLPDKLLARIAPYLGVKPLAIKRYNATEGDAA